MIETEYFRRTWNVILKNIGDPPFRGGVLTAIKGNGFLRRLFLHNSAKRGKAAEHCNAPAVRAAPESILSHPTEFDRGKSYTETVLRMGRFSLYNGLVPRYTESRKV